MREFDLIATLRERLEPRRPDTRLGIGDDAALLAPPAGYELAVTTDTLIGGRHFHHDTAAFDVGYKALAVNLSDLAAMGADPAWVTLALAAPALEPVWCRALVDGALAAIGNTPVDIVGGDTTRGPLAITVTALGQLPAGQAVRRDGARPGDAIAVTGTLGDAAAGLAAWPQRLQTDDADIRYLVERLTRPQWRRGVAMRGRVHAAVDISDGLVADLGHILAASDCGACIDLAALPCSEALARHISDERSRQRMQLTGGDDYELCMTLDPAQIESVSQRLGCTLTRIGQIDDQPGLRLCSHDGAIVSADTLDVAGWDHFS